MSVPVTRKKIAQALSVIAEAGLEGFEYDSAVNALGGESYASRRMRWSMVPNSKFAPSEFRELLAYAARARYIEAGDHTERVANGEYGIEAWTIRLTLDGWDQIELHDQTIIERWFRNIRDNLPALLVSAFVAVLSSWALYMWGAPDRGQSINGRTESSASLSNP
ncbi:MAG TPA: hypothetical protein PLI43_09685 [Albidovulum sp.]|uniref:hypothetical protein n=1 Tax=Albidovulum sp. TaxID=1872424 RepID=UPI002C711306|nr:hypothetical protein [Albidovulum sp.]